MTGCLRLGDCVESSGISVLQTRGAGAEKVGVSSTEACMVAVSDELLMSSTVFVVVECSCKSAVAMFAPESVSV